MGEPYNEEANQLIAEWGLLVDARDAAIVRAEMYRETNSRLNLRCQKAESALAQQAKETRQERAWTVGYDLGVIQGLDRGKCRHNQALQKQGAKLRRMKADRDAWKAKAGNLADGPACSCMAKEDDAAVHQEGCPRQGWSE